MAQLVRIATNIQPARITKAERVTARMPRKSGISPTFIDPPLIPDAEPFCRVFLIPWPLRDILSCFWTSLLSVPIPCSISGRSREGTRTGSRADPGHHGIFSRLTAREAFTRIQAGAPNLGEIWQNKQASIPEPDNATHCPTTTSLDRVPDFSYPGTVVQELVSSRKRLLRLPRFSAEASKGWRI